MEVDSTERNEAAKETQAVQTSEVTDKEPTFSVAPSPQENSTPTVEVNGVKTEAEEPPVDFSTLYPIFWGLQENFSSPTRLFDPKNFDSFKVGLGFICGVGREAQCDSQNECEDG